MKLTELLVVRNCAGYSYLIADRDPAIMQVVASTKNLKVESVGSHGFGNLINLFWFLGLAAPLSKHEVTNSFGRGEAIFGDVALCSYEASFLCML